MRWWCAWSAPSGGPSSSRRGRKGLQYLRWHPCHRACGARVRPLAALPTRRPSPPLRPPGRSEVYALWENRLNWPEWFGMIEDVGFTEGAEDVCALNMWYRWGEHAVLPRAPPPRCMVGGAASGRQGAERAAGGMTGSPATCWAVAARLPRLPRLLVCLRLRQRACSSF
jgi:hypothetical protein